MSVWFEAKILSDQERSTLSLLKTTFLFVYSILRNAYSFGVIDRGTTGFAFTFDLLTKWRECFKNDCPLRRIGLGFTLLRQAIGLKKTRATFSANHK